MKRIKIYLIATIAGLLFTTTSCDFGNLNVDPTQLSSVELRSILPAALSQMAYNQGALAGRMPGILMQHFIGFDAQQVPYTTYKINEADMNNLWVTGMYVGAMRDCDVIIKQATEEEQPYYVGIAKVVMAHELDIVTTFWGDAPYSEAFEGNEQLKPAFDLQSDIYATMFRLLDEAIVELGKSSVPGGPAGDDLIFGGNADKWIATAYALKARLHIQMTKKDPTTHAQAALVEVANAYNAGFVSVNDEPMFHFGSAKTEANPYAQFGAQRPKTLIINPAFHDDMEGKSDPRVSKYMAWDGSDWRFFAGPESSLFWSRNDSPIPIISFTELKFIEAEALLRTGKDPEAETAFEEAVTASMDQLGIAPDDYKAYVAGYANFIGLTTMEEKLERLIVEKYYALYAQAEPEIWSDYRRTGYPALTPVPGGDHGLNPGGQIPRRFIYPSDERSTNDVQMQAAIDRLGADDMAHDIWVFKD
jgi:hypothetical protein